MLDYAMVFNYDGSDDSNNSHFNFDDKLFTNNILGGADCRIILLN
jgi:hypothetical protein